MVPGIVPSLSDIYSDIRRIKLQPHPIFLMIFTILWRINPTEGSVIPQFLRHNSLGTAVICFLLGTSMPVWIFLLISSRVFLALGFRDGVFPDSTWATA